MIADALLTPAEVGVLLSVSTRQVYRLVTEAGLPAIRLTFGGDLRFQPADVAAWIESRKVVAA